MGSLVQHFNALPNGAHNVEIDPQARSGRIWCRDGAGQVVSVTHSEAPNALAADPKKAIRDRGWAPILGLLDASVMPDLFDWSCRTHEQVFAYDVVVPESEEAWVRDFVRGPERSDSLPDSWSETHLTDGSGDHTHTLCSYKATVAVARGMAYVQRASSVVVMSKIKAGVGMVQRIAEINGFSGWRSVSALPEERAEELYEPQDLYQLIDPRIYDPSTDADSEDPRGEAFTTDDFLNARDLTRL